jgi:hypothetical protein
MLSSDALEVADEPAGLFRVSGGCPDGRPVGDHRRRQMDRDHHACRPALAAPHCHRRAQVLALCRERQAPTLFGVEPPTRGLKRPHCRRPADAHHLRFAQSRAMANKASDEFTVPLCRGHHREVHRSGDEAEWWSGKGIDPIVAARSLWLKSHPLPADFGGSRTKPAADTPAAKVDLSLSRAGANAKAKPNLSAPSQ